MSLDAEPIICRVTPWYKKRRIAMLLLVFGFAVAFMYDWKVKYPRNKEAAEYYKGLPEATRDKDYEAVRQEKNWPEKAEPKTDWDYKIAEQLAFGILCIVSSSVMLFFYIRTVRGALTADAESFSTADGQKVPFASAFRIDRRKWDHKGLAYVYYKDAKGAEKRAVIDDLIFGGAVKVLDRLSANFHGEVIDLEKKEEAPVAAEPTEEKPAAEEPQAGA